MTVFIHIDDTPVADLRLPPAETIIHILDHGEPVELLVQEHLGTLPMPLSHPVQPRANPEALYASSCVHILPIEGGGRGPIVNFGETVTLGMVLDLLAEAVSETELTQALQERLNRMDALLVIEEDRGKNDQTGYATHNDTINLDHPWAQAPQIELCHSHGLVRTSVETDINGNTYWTTPDQEIVYGHGGFRNNAFTIKAAILEYAAATIAPIAWLSPSQVGAGLTGASPLTNTTAACMGLQIEGTLQLASTGTPATSGTIRAEMSVDGSDWFTIGEFAHRFGYLDSVPVTRQLSALLAFDQTMHSYRFRAELLPDTPEDPNEELTGSLYIATVTESGSGVILSNDLQIKWSAKE